MKGASLAKKKSSDLRVPTARRMNRIELHQRKKGCGTEMTNA
jgi:hypothetical protein